MAEYRFKLYRRPDPALTVGRLVDELIIQADDDQDAIRQARNPVAPYHYEWDYAELWGPEEDRLVWREDASDADYRAADT